MRKTRDLSIVAMYIALYVVLAKYSELFIPLLKMPKGGSIELSIIVILIASYHLGVKKALTVALMGLLLEYTLAGKAFQGVSVLQVLLDYVVAFGIYAFASVLPPNSERIPVGVLITNALRYIAHTVSGVLFFIEADSMGAIWYGSAVYNFPYMLANTVISFLVIILILPRLRKGLSED